MCDEYNKVFAMVIGCGSRGNTFANYEELKVVAAADTNEKVLEAFRKKHSIPEKFIFDSWQKILELSVVHDLESAHEVTFRRTTAQGDENRQQKDLVVIIATPDRIHAGPAVQAASLGIHILLEKPMATSEEDCMRIVETSEAYKIVCSIGHVLRHSPANEKIGEMIQNKAIGEVLSIRHMEPVGWWHFAHSFVRGNWRSEKESTFLLMSKCCHDLDLIAWWAALAEESNFHKVHSDANFSKCVEAEKKIRDRTEQGNALLPPQGGNSNQGVNRRSVRVASFGNLKHFNYKNKPVEAKSVTRCCDCPLKSSCIYSANRIYLDYLCDQQKVSGWPLDVVVGDGKQVERGSLEKALKTNSYGKCVYESDNDVCDHQSVLMEFPSGLTANFSVVSCTERFCKRMTEIYGSKGQLTSTEGNAVVHHDFAAQSEKRIDCIDDSSSCKLKGHDGSDGHLMRSFINAVRLCDPKAVSTSPKESLFSHQLVFAAENARLTGVPQQIFLD